MGTWKTGAVCGSLSAKSGKRYGDRMDALRVVFAVHPAIDVRHRHREIGARASLPILQRVKVNPFGLEQTRQAPMLRAMSAATAATKWAG